MTWHGCILRHYNFIHVCLEWQQTCAKLSELFSWSLEEWTFKELQLCAIRISSVCAQVYLHVAAAVCIADKRYLKYQAIRRGRDLWMFPDSVDINNVLTVCLFSFCLCWSRHCCFGFLRVGSVDIYYHANLFPIFDKARDPKKSAP